MTEVPARTSARRYPAARANRALRALAIGAVVLVGALSLLLVQPAPVSAAPEVTNPSVEMPDPASITFKARLTADADIASATVNYKILNPDGNIGGTLKAEVVGGRAVDAAVTLQTNNNDRYIPTGTQVTYSWTVTDKNGASTTSKEETITFLDGRFQWLSKQEGRVSVYWYGASSANAEVAMRATLESIVHNEELLKVKLEYPVRVVVYRNSAEAKPAQRPRAATFDQQIVTGGSRVATNVLHIYDPLGGFEDVARHEAGHIVTKVAGDGKVSTLPSWIDEGTAVYSQKSVGGYGPALQRAIQTDQLLRIRNMAAPSNQPSQVDIFYGQSWAVVKFIIDKHGKDKFAAIFKSVKDGAPIDDALQTNIGMDQDGLYNAWRVSVGLKAIDFPPVPKSTSIAGSQATQPPLGIPTSVTSAANTDGTGGGVSSAPGAVVSTTTAAVVGGGTLLVAAALGFFAMRMMKKS